MKISVVTAVFNNRQTIAAAIDSVLSQTGVEVELLVIDGGSTDGTLDVLLAYGDRLAVLVSEPDRGIFDALNKGIQLATGDVVGFLHSDDLFADEKVLAQIAAAFAASEVGAVYGDLLYVRRDQPEVVVRYWRAGEFSQRRLGWGWMPPHPTFYVRRSVYERLGTFDLRYRIAADYDTMLRFLGKGKVHADYIPKVLVRMRLGGTSNRSFVNIVRKSQEDYLALRRNGLGGMGALTWKNLSKVKQFFLR